MQIINPKLSDFASLPWKFQIPFKWANCHNAIFHLGQDLELGFVDDQPGLVLILALEKAAQLADPNLNLSPKGRNPDPNPGILDPKGRNPDPNPGILDPKGQNPDPNPGRDPNRNHVQWPDPKDLHQNPENPDLDPVQDQKDLGRNNRKDLEDLADLIVKTEILKNVGERRRKGNEKLKIEIQWKWNQISIQTNGNLKKVCKIYQMIFFSLIY